MIVGYHFVIESIAAVRDKKDDEMTDDGVLSKLIN